MRLLVDSLIALMLAGILAGVLLHHRKQTYRLDQTLLVHQALGKIQDQVLYRGALEQGRPGAPQYPTAISPLWFEGNLPLNILVPGRQPWIDLAPMNDLGDHPPDPLIVNSQQAGFWYNPNRGLVRARVTSQFTDHETLRLYNQLNNTYLRSLPTSDDPGRKPQPLDLTAIRTIPAELQNTGSNKKATSVEPVSHPVPTLRDRNPAKP